MEKVRFILGIAFWMLGFWPGLWTLLWNVAFIADGRFIGSLENEGWLAWSSLASVPFFFAKSRVVRIGLSVGLALSGLVLLVAAPWDRAFLAVIIAMPLISLAVCPSAKASSVKPI